MFRRFAVLAVVLVLCFSGSASAMPVLDWGSHVNPGVCDSSGALVVNVRERVVQSVDSGEGGNYWAFDNYTRHIQVWRESGGSYCVLVAYEGMFDGQAGQLSPGAGGVLSGDEDGTFQGGYWATITGVLKSTPSWPRRGFAGVHDYQCDISGSCPGYISWIDQYFEPGWSFTYNWWGWIYHGGSHGTWENAVDGNQGDIL